MYTDCFGTLSRICDSSSRALLESPAGGLYNTPTVIGLLSLAMVKNNVSRFGEICDKL